MELNEYQKKAHKTAVYPKFGTMKFIYPVLGLNGEAGEVAEKIKKVIRDKNGIIDTETKREIKDEIGDCLWYLSEMASSLRLKLDDIAETNLEKLKNRKKNNTLQGSGDSR